MSDRDIVMRAAKAECVVLKLVPTNVITGRWTCHGCAYGDTKWSVLIESDEGFRVCPDCLERGVPAALAKLAERAEQCGDAVLAAALIVIAGKVEAPIYAEWEAAERASPLCMLAE
jgi:hypothetical protein